MPQFKGSFLPPSRPRPAPRLPLCWVFLLLCLLFAPAALAAPNPPIRTALIVQGPDEGQNRLVKNQLDQALNLLSGIRAVDAYRLDDKAEGWMHRDFPPAERPKWARQLHCDVLYLIRIQSVDKLWQVELEHYDGRLGKSSAVARPEPFAPARLAPDLFATLLARFKIQAPAAQKPALDKLFAYQPESQALRASALLAIARGDLAPALERLDQALKLSPAQAGLLLERGDLKALSGDFAGAIEGFSAALEAIPAWPEALYLRALAQARLGRYDLCERDLESAYRIKSEFNPELAYLLGKSALEKQSAASIQALAYFKQSVLSDSGFAPGYQSIGQWYLEQHFTTEALKNFELGFKSDPDPETLYGLLTARSIALTSLSTKHTAESLTGLTQAINLAPAKPLAWYLRGLDWAILGNCPKARFDWSKACKLGQGEACKQHCP